MDIANSYVKGWPLAYLVRDMLCRSKAVLFAKEALSIWFFKKAFYFKKFEVYRKVAEILQSSPTLHTSFPLLLASYIRLVHLLHLTKQY